MKNRTIGFLCLMAFAAMFAGCKGGQMKEEETMGNDPQGFVVKGTLGGALNKGDIIYLNRDDRQGAVVDSARIGADGSYMFKGQVETPWVGYIWTPKLQGGMVCVIESDTVWVGVDSVWGTPMNERLTAFNRSLETDDLEAEMEPYIKIYYNTGSARRRAEAERVLDSLMAVGTERGMRTCWDFYRENEDNALGAIAMGYIAEMGDFSYHQFDSIVRSASPAVAGYGPVQRRLEQLRRIDVTSSGKHYIDVQGVDGKLSDLIEGKLALVDFYASWCAPCRNEIKNYLVPLWKKYQDKGLVIVGLNVWETGDAAARKAAHEKVMKDLGITYPQLVDSTRTATDTYGVTGIPQIMLIGPDGTILARDLREDNIEEAIIKALKK